MYREGFRKGGAGRYKSCRNSFMNGVIGGGGLEEAKHANFSLNTYHPSTNIHKVVRLALCIYRTNPS